jgi:hypothetical protein
VSNTAVRIKDLCEVGLFGVNQLLQLCYLANLLVGKDFVSLVSINGQTS